MSGSKSVASNMSPKVAAAVRAFMRPDAVVITITRNIPTASGGTFDKVTITGNGVVHEYYLNAVTPEHTQANGIVEQSIAIARIKPRGEAPAPSAPVAEPSFV